MALENIHTGSGKHPFSSSLWVSDVSSSGIKRREREAGHSFLYTADIKKLEFYCLLLLYIYMPCSGTSLTLLDCTSMRGVSRETCRYENVCDILRYRLEDNIKIGN
jgi:hypothetical protein